MMSEMNHLRWERSFTPVTDPLAFGDRLCYTACNSVLQRPSSAVHVTRSPARQPGFVFV